MIFLGSKEVTLLPSATTEQFMYGMVAMPNGRVVRGGFHEYDPSDPTNPYGSIEVDVVVQVVDVTGTTPVVATTTRYPLRPLEGDFPFHERGRVLRLDESRVALLWHSGPQSVRFQIVRINADASVTFGTPVHIATGNLVVQNEDAGYTSNIDPHIDDQAVVLTEGRVVYIARVRRYVYADTTNWKEVLSACHIRTDGLGVVDNVWWFLNRDTAHDRTAFSNVDYESYQDALHLDGGRLWHLWGRTSDGMRMATLDFGAANVQVTPIWTNVALVSKPQRQVEKTSAKIVMRDNTNFYIVDLADPLGAVHVAPIPDPNTYHVMMLSYIVQLDHSSPTARNGFWSGRNVAPDFVDIELVEYLVSDAGAVTQGRVVAVPSTPPPKAGSQYGIGLVINGGRTLVVVDYNGLTDPFNFPEMGHLYYDQLPTIDTGGNQSRFLQVRAGV